MISLKIKDYLIITAIGDTIVGISLSTSALEPTYGVAGHSLVLLASYLFSVGLYSSAILVSQDSSLRQSIRKSAAELLDDIGTAQMEQELKARIMKLVQDNEEKMKEQTGISSSLTEDEIKEYLKQVIEETSVKRKR
jgi:Tfp pilus assembly PilM family ATPase